MIVCNRFSFLRIFGTLLLLLLPMTLCAQKKDIAQAREYIKKGSNVDKAEQMMRKLLTDSVNRSNMKIWITLSEAVRKQYELGNEKLYLRQKYDTAALFVTAKNMFSVMEQIDSIETQLNQTQNGKYKYRDKHADYLATYRPNLYNGGLFFIRKQKFSDAYDFLNKYIECANLPLFRKFNYLEKDTLIPQAAYWAVYCGYKMKDPKATLHHTYLALKDTAHHMLMLQYLAETYKLEKDTARYLSTLNEGFDKYPRFSFFFPRLIEYYTGREDWKSGLEIANRALSVDAGNKVFRITKSSLLLNLGFYTECISICDSLIAEDKEMAEAYLNAGLGYFNQAVELDKSTGVSAKRQQSILALYRKSLPYMETYRKLAPDKQEKWALPLYTIYLNLNKGKEFDEIDKLIRNTKRT